MIFSTCAQTHRHLPSLILEGASQALFCILNCRDLHLLSLLILFQLLLTLLSNLTVPLYPISTLLTPARYSGVQRLHITPGTNNSYSLLLGPHSQLETFCGPHAQGKSHCWTGSLSDPATPSLSELILLSTFPTGITIDTHIVQTHLVHFLNSLNFKSIE